MQLFVVQAILTCLTLSYHVCGLDHNNMKPKFVPYCTTRDGCKAACSCAVSEGCAVLELDDMTRKNILHYHNQLRDTQSAGEPVPGGMTMLTYDENLEEISRCWAARCQNEYSECFTTPKFNATSQAISQIITTECFPPRNTKVLEIINSWLGQTKYTSVQTLTAFPANEQGEKIHNFAQILSDRILSVGCAWSLKRKALTFVCSYGPRGPLLGEPIYRIGPECSLCPENYACDHEKPFMRLCKPQPQLTSPVQYPPEPPPIPPQRIDAPPQPPPKPATQSPEPPLTAPPAPPPFQIVPIPTAPTFSLIPSSPTVPPSFQIVPIPTAPTCSQIPFSPPKPPPFPIVPIPTAPTCSPIPFSPPKPPRVPPTPPPRRFHVSPPPVPPRAPPPTYVVGEPCDHPPPVTSQVRQRMVEMPSALTRISGGALDSPSNWLTDKSNSHRYFPPPPPPLPHAIPTPPPLPRPPPITPLLRVPPPPPLPRLPSSPHLPQKPPHLPIPQFHRENPPPDLHPHEASDEDTWISSMPKDRPPFLPQPPMEPLTRPPRLPTVPHRTLPHQFINAMAPPRLPPQLGV